MNKEQMAEIRNYKVYMHTLPNGLAYVGITSMEKLYNRFNYGGGYDKQPFYKAIVDFGWSCVSTNILDELECDWYEAAAAEKYWIAKMSKQGYILCNKAGLPKEYKYAGHAGCTIIETNTYYSTLKEAADFIGVTKQAVSLALKEQRPCKGYNLAYGDITKKVEEKNENE